MDGHVTSERTIRERAAARAMHRPTAGDTPHRKRCKLALCRTFFWPDNPKDNFCCFEHRLEWHNTWDGR